MEFGVEKYAMVLIKCGEKQTIEGIELPNQERIISLGGKGNKY